MNIYIFGKGFNYSQDGPGNRLVYHLAGCNMSCPWCSNPEGMSPQRNRPDVKEVTLDKICNEILAAAPLFYDGGGVTFTGGETTLQFEPLKELLAFCKAHSISTAIETNGTHIRLPELLPLIDYLMIDFKHYDSQALQNYTGVNGVTTIHNLEYIAQNHIDALIRIPLIKEFNCRDKDICGFCNCFERFKALASGSCSFSVELLPYHEYGKGKWEKMGVPYRIEQGYVDTDYVEKMKQSLDNIGIRVKRT